MNNPYAPAVTSYAPTTMAAPTVYPAPVATAAPLAAPVAAAPAVYPAPYPVPMAAPVATAAPTVYEDIKTMTPFGVQDTMVPMNNPYAPAMTSYAPTFPMAPSAV